jgi:hypothetical protein
VKTARPVLLTRLGGSGHKRTVPQHHPDNRPETIQRVMEGGAWLEVSLILNTVARTRYTWHMSRSNVVHLQQFSAMNSDDRIL